VVLGLGAFRRFLRSVQTIQTLFSNERDLEANLVGLESARSHANYSAFGASATDPTTMKGLQLALQKAKTSHAEAGTQTVGIFYPSSVDMKKKETEEDMRARLEREMRDRAPLLTTISPGRG